MAYRVSARFRDGSANMSVAGLADAALPRLGDTISVARHGLVVPMRVIATWRPSSKLPGDGLLIVEARELT